MCDEEIKDPAPQLETVYTFCEGDFDEHGLEQFRRKILQSNNSHNPAGNWRVPIIPGTKEFEFRRPCASNQEPLVTYSVEGELTLRSDVKDRLRDIIREMAWDEITSILDIMREAGEFAPCP